MPAGRPTNPRKLLMAYSALERNFSMEDITGWTANFGRSNSEAAFQDFLKRIPSQSNLQAAANQGLDPAAVQSMFQGGMAENYAGPGVGLPRIPSLDFLRQLAHAQQVASAGVPAIKVEQQQQHLPVASALQHHLPGVPHATATHLANPAYNAAAASSYVSNGQQAQQQPHDHHTVAAAAMTLNQFSKQPNTYSNAQSEGTSPSSNDRDGEGAVPKEGRKARRMLSNRESARRSRRRKQEHLSKLEQEINGMVEEKKTWTDQAANLERRCKVADDENRRLKEENERLRDELQFLRSELKELHSYARRKSLYKKDESGPKKRSLEESPKEEAL